jgi:hypothetical protein
MLAIQAETSPLYRTARIIQIQPELDIAQALSKDATARRIISAGVELHEGQRIGSRLNLNILKSTGVFVNTIHAPTNNNDGHKRNRGWWNGKVLAYRPVVELRNVYFNVNQASRDKIASGLSAKIPMASADGNLLSRDNYRFDGIEVRFNPHKVRFFVDANNNPIHFAEQATIIGHQVFVRGLVKYYEDVDEAPPKIGSAPCAVKYFQEMNQYNLLACK